MKNPLIHGIGLVAAVLGAIVGVLLGEVGSHVWGAAIGGAMGFVLGELTSVVVQSLKLAARARQVRSIGARGAVDFDAEHALFQRALDELGPEHIQVLGVLTWNSRLRPFLPRSLRFDAHWAEFLPAMQEYKESVPRGKLDAPPSALIEKLDQVASDLRRYGFLREGELPLSAADLFGGSYPDTLAGPSSDSRENLGSELETDRGERFLAFVDSLAARPRQK